MNKCIGCGASLQSSNPELLGYVKNENQRLCERCFKIQNYGEYLPMIKEEKEFINMLNDISDTNDLVVLVCDLFNFNPNMDMIKKYVKNDILLVLTKRDLLPKSLYEEKLINYISDTELNIVDKIIISSFNNYNFDFLLEKINKYKKSKNVYVIGYTNVGKSTMINKILYNYSDNKNEITTSMLPNTTMDNISIKINEDLYLIDTPGVIDEGNICYFRNIKEIKHIIPKKAIKPIGFQIKHKQNIIIEDLVVLNVAYNDIVIYMSNALKINRVYKDVNTDLKKHELNVKAGSDVVIKGLGFIKFMKDEKITLYTLEGVDVFVRKSLI